MYAVSCGLMTITRQRKKDIKEIEKIEKYSQENVRIVYNSFCVYVCLCVKIEFAYYFVWSYK